MLTNQNFNIRKAQNRNVNIKRKDFKTLLLLHVTENNLLSESAYPLQ